MPVKDELDQFWQRREDQANYSPDAAEGHGRERSCEPTSGPLGDVWPASDNEEESAYNCDHRQTRRKELHHFGSFVRVSGIGSINFRSSGSSRAMMFFSFPLLLLAGFLISTVKADEPVATFGETLV
jgi:hypothetical protein